MKVIGAIGVFIAGAAAGVLVSLLCRTGSPQPEVIKETDTLVVRDTIIEDKPVFVTITKLDTMLIAIRDTVHLTDTAYVVVEREQKHYKGDDYEAWVSGYRPALDSIWVYPETRYVTKTVPVSSKKRWGIGIQVGYGVSLPEGKPQLAPYIGVGLSYNLIRF